MWTYFGFAGMAADQRKKRVKSSSLAGCRSRDEHRAKRKRLELPQHDVVMRPNISLEWDNKRKSVVSKREQIGISWRHLRAFIEPAPYTHKMLADVFSVPQEIFQLETLSEVLSYEVWQSHFSEEERSALAQFLPRESEPDIIVRDLLAGNNFHFGNPFVKWSASLCSGELHPDNVLPKEQALKVCKKAYHSDIQKYHNNMIVNLQTWKEKWASCSDPEVDIWQNMWRSRKCAEKTLPPSETQFYDTVENIVASPESCSWATSENAYSSDNQHAGMLHGESQGRNGILNKVSDCSSNGKKVAAILKKGEKLHKQRDISLKKGAKYMSYIKVSKELHGRVKSSMEHGKNSIQPKSLNNLLASTDALNVQPFERFEEEERKKLHDYWLKLAKKDISEGFGTWRKRQLRRQEVMWSLSEEIEQTEQSMAMKNKEEEGSTQDLVEQLDDCAEGTPLVASIEGVEKVHSDDMIQEQIRNEVVIKHDKEKRINNIFEEQIYNATDMIEEEEMPENVPIHDHEEEDDVPENVLIPDHEEEDDAAGNVLVHDHEGDNDVLNNVLIPYHEPQQIALLAGNSQVNSTEIQPHGNSASVKEVGNLNQVNLSVSHGPPLPSVCDVWPDHASVYQSTAANDGYASAHELSVAPQFIQEQPSQMLDQEARLNKDSGNNMLHGESTGTSYLDSQPNEDQNEYLQSFFNGGGRFPYHQEPKNTGMQFHPGNVTMMETDQFSQPNNMYTHSNIGDSICSDGRPYVLPRSEQLPVSIHNWATPNFVSMSTPSEPHLSGAELTRNFYKSENGAPEVWPTFEGGAVGMNHSFSSGSNLDQTLFSVLSECNEFRPVTTFDPMGSSEQVMPAGNYNGIQEVISSSSSVLNQPPNPLNYLSGHEPKINNLGWVCLSQPNSGMHETMGKPFLRPWNQ